MLQLRMTVEFAESPRSTATACAAAASEATPISVSLSAVFTPHSSRHAPFGALFFDPPTLPHTAASEQKLLR
jgi:hypothetical protein